MKHLFSAVLLTLFTSNAFAFAVEVKSCSSTTETHRYTADQVDGGVLVTFENLKLQNWGQVGRSPKYKYSGKIKIEMLVQDVSLVDFVNSPAASESLVSAMFSLPEYEAEPDMVHYYANKQLSLLECK